MVNGDERRMLGATGLEVTALCSGGGPIGSMPENFGHELGDADGVALVEAILASPIRFLDTSNGYSGGRSEERIGLGIAAAGGLPADFVVGTKVDAKDGDYSGARVRASVAESRERLGIDVLPLVSLHDPEYFDFDVITAPGGAVDTLAALRDEGVIGHLGLAGGPMPEMRRYLDLGVFETLLVHNRWTLVDRSAGDLIAVAVDRGLGVLNAAVYGGGILAKPHESTKYAYREAPPAVLDAVRAMADACERHGTELGTAALQFSLRDARVTSTIVGFSSPGRIDELLGAASAELPDALWDELESLVPAQEFWLDPR